MNSPGFTSSQKVLTTSPSQNFFPLFPNIMETEKCISQSWVHFSCLAVSILNKEYCFIFTDHQQTEELFAHDLIQRHASVVSIEELTWSGSNNSFSHPLKFGLYNFNFFHETSGKPKIQLNSVWTQGSTFKSFDQESIFHIFIGVPLE